MANTIFLGLLQWEHAGAGHRLPPVKGLLSSQGLPDICGVFWPVQMGAGGGRA